MPEKKYELTSKDFLLIETTAASDRIDAERAKRRRGKKVAS